MIAFLYRWRIPSNEAEEFRSNWKELTEQVQIAYSGFISAELYEVEGGFIAIGRWQSREDWQQWKTLLSKHPYRERWRKCRVSGPEEMKISVSIV